MDRGRSYSPSILGPWTEVTGSILLNYPYACGQLPKQQPFYGSSLLNYSYACGQRSKPQPFYGSSLLNYSYACGQRPKPQPFYGSSLLNYSYACGQLPKQQPFYGSSLLNYSYACGQRPKQQSFHGFSLLHYSYACGKRSKPQLFYYRTMEGNNWFHSIEHSIIGPWREITGSILLNYHMHVDRGLGLSLSILGQRRKTTGSILLNYSYVCGQRLKSQPFYSRTMEGNNWFHLIKLFICIVYRGGSHSPSILGQRREITGFILLN